MTPYDLDKIPAEIARLHDMVQSAGRVEKF
jgi:hypothetical protein